MCGHALYRSCRIFSHRSVSQALLFLLRFPLLHRARRASYFAAGSRTEPLALANFNER